MGADATETVSAVEVSETNRNELPPVLMIFQHGLLSLSQEEVILILALSGNGTILMV